MSSSAHTSTRFRAAPPAVYEVDVYSWHQWVALTTSIACIILSGLVVALTFGYFHVPFPQEHTQLFSVIFLGSLGIMLFAPFVISICVAPINNKVTVEQDRITFSCRPPVLFDDIASYQTSRQGLRLQLKGRFYRMAFTDAPNDLLFRDAFVKAITLWSHEQMHARQTNRDKTYSTQTARRDNLNNFEPPRHDYFIGSKEARLMGLAYVGVALLGFFVAFKIGKYKLAFYALLCLGIGAILL